MKTSRFYKTFLLLCLIHANTVLCSAADEPAPQPEEAVIDNVGNMVRTGTNNYWAYLKPANMSGKYSGGGVGLRGMNGNMSDSSCPLCVIQELQELRDGLALSFYPAVEPEDGIVRVNTDLNLQFGFPDTCNQPVNWRLEKTDGTWFVNLGGEIGNPGPETLRNWFKIVRIDGEEDGVFKYKMVFCPTAVCSSCKFKCKDVGIVVQNGKRRLALAKDPFELIFDRA